jgi:hypothetical protein
MHGQYIDRAVRDAAGVLVVQDTGHWVVLHLADGNAPLGSMTNWQSQKINWGKFPS